MSKVVRFGALAVLSTIAVAQPSEPDVKGIYIGMAKEEFDVAFAQGLKGFTVAGVGSKYSSGADATFVDGKLDRLLMFFDSAEYRIVRDALSSKYPQLKCEQEEIQAKAGVKYQDENCTVGKIKLRRFVSDVKTSVISMYSERFIQEQKAKRDEKKKDI
jgi:hypothetical protein